MNSSFTNNLDKGWKLKRRNPSLPEVYRSLPVPKKGSWLKKFSAFVGPGYLVAVGYMDPGNWATDLAGGSLFNYDLLFVILLSNIMAIFLQALAGKLGIVTGRDLAQACRDHYSKGVSFVLWIFCEIAIAACDLAELIGSAIALNLLFGINLVLGVIITALDVLLVLALQSKGFRYIETIVISLIFVIGCCFLVELILAKPDLFGIMEGFLPKSRIISNPQMFYIAIGILGATVMPHNLYLHSAIVQTRKYDEDIEGRRKALTYATWDSSIALLLALFINAAILILSAATFYTSKQEVNDIGQAYNLLSPLLGTSLASILFGIALLAAGQNSTLTGTLAGQIVMEGFLNIKLKPWLRRLITRFIALVPAVVVIFLYGSKGTMQLLLFSQVVLSFQLPFAVFPLVQFTSDPEKMGIFVNGTLVKVIAWFMAFFIALLNIYLLYKVFI